MDHSVSIISHLTYNVQLMMLKDWSTLPKCFHLAEDIYPVKGLMSSSDSEVYIGNVVIDTASLIG